MTAWCALPECLRKTVVHRLYPDCCQSAMQSCSAVIFETKGPGVQSTEVCCLVGSFSAV